MRGKEGGKYAVVVAVLVGLTGFLSLLLLSPGSRIGPSQYPFPAAMAFVVSQLVGALPKAQAFATTGSLARMSYPAGPGRTTAESIRRFTSSGRYTAWWTTPVPTSTSPLLRGLTGSSKLFASTGNAAGMEERAKGGPTYVLVPVADGSEEIESVTVIDTLVRAGALVTVASVGDTAEVTCSRGVKITADCKIAECPVRDWDAVVCPGGMPGATNLKENKLLEEILRKQESEGRIVAAICAAPAVVLASHGLLEGRKATCYPAEAFRGQLPEAVDDKVVVDGNIITSQGPATSLAFAIQLVDSLFGAAKAKEVGDAMLFP